MDIINTGYDVDQNESTSGKKQYVKPAIIHELLLETRAGSPLGPIGLDPLDDAAGIWGTGTDK